MSSNPSLEHQARALIDDFDGDAAFLARHLASGVEVGYRADAIMPTASSIKLLVLAELFRQVEAGEQRLDERVVMLPDDQRGGSGILKDLAPDVRLSLRDHATLMTALSDNTSTAVLVRLLGHQRILQSAREWGMTSTTAGFRVPDGGSARNYAASSPRDLVQLLTLIATDGFLSPAACQTMRDILLTQQYHEQIARYLPYSQYQREGARPQGELVVRSKSGFMNDTARGGVRVDAGIVEVVGRASWVICLMTEGSPDRGFGPEHPGAVLNGRISRLIYEAWGSGD